MYKKLSVNKFSVANLFWGILELSTQNTTTHNLLGNLLCDIKLIRFFDKFIKS